MLGQAISHANLPTCPCDPFPWPDPSLCSMPCLLPCCLCPPQTAACHTRRLPVPLVPLVLAAGHPCVGIWTGEGPQGFSQADWERFNETALQSDWIHYRIDSNRSCSSLCFFPVSSPSPPLTLRCCLSSIWAHGTWKLSSCLATQQCQWCRLAGQERRLHVLHARERPRPQAEPSCAWQEGEGEGGAEAAEEKGKGVSILLWVSLWP